MFKFCKVISVVLVLVLLCVGCGRGNAPSQPALDQNSGESAGSDFTLPTHLSGSLSLGDIMPELTVNTAEGDTLVLSQLLRQKKAVVLNFWYADCIWCRREFPAMETSYQRHVEDVEILAVNPFDSKQSIAAFQKDQGLSFPMASCSRDLALAFGITGYPTSVVIDREGRVCLIHPGAITDARVFDKLFETFTAENYTPRVYHSINDLL